MSSQRQWLVCIVTCFVPLTGGGALGAQARFEGMTRDGVAAVPGLQVIMVRDNTLNACYTLFVIDAASPLQALPPIEARSVQNAAAERDRRLSELSTELEKTRSTVVAGTLGPDILKYEWEGQKAQSEFERVLLENEVARLEAPLKRIADAPKLAVSGPAPCGAAIPSVPREQR
jgi:hypothetical protein